MANSPIQASDQPSTELTELESLKQENAQLRHVLNTAVSEKQRNVEINKNLENIIAMMPGNIYWVDKNGKYQYCNDQNAAMLNLPHRDHIKGKSIFELMPVEFATPVHQNDQKVMQLGEPITIEEIGIDQNTQQIKLYLTKKAPLRDSKGAIIGVFGLAVDITERKEIEKQLEIAKSQAEIASEAKSEFIANMSHDLRTPFSGILGFAHHLYQNETSDNKKKELGYIIQSAEKLLALLNDILQSTKDGLDHQFTNSEFDFLQVVEETKLLFTAEIERKKLQFLIVSGYRSVKVFSDKHRLHRILINLVSNAVKFTERGAVTVTVDLSKLNEGDWLHFTISDTGLGIASDEHNAIFERFTRLNAAYQGKYVGIGIGLWLVKKFIDDLKGIIKVDSTLSVGTTFICQIPVKLLSYQLIKQQEDHESPPTLLPTVALTKSPTTNTQVRILMVEDDEITLTIQQRFLQELKYEIDAARSGQEALQMAKQVHYDYIFLDIGLPDMDGFELAERIRNEVPLNTTTPIIGLTAHINQSVQADWQSKNINKLILKPLTHSLCEEIPNWFKSKTGI